MLSTTLYLSADAITQLHADYDKLFSTACKALVARHPKKATVIYDSEITVKRCKSADGSPYLYITAVL